MKLLRKHAPSLLLIVILIPSAVAFWFAEKEQPVECWPDATQPPLC